MLKRGQVLSLLVVWKLPQEPVALVQVPAVRALEQVVLLPQALAVVVREWSPLQEQLRLRDQMLRWRP